MSILRKAYLTADSVKRLLLDCGMLRSIWAGASIDREGRPLPWLSLPAIQFLDSLDLQGARVFEFGSGNSTLFWQKKHENGQIRSYSAIEYDRQYYFKNSDRNGFYRDNVRWPGDENAYFDAPFLIATSGTAQEMYFQPYDLSIVDGPIQWRARELEAALKYTCTEGLIVVDDSNWISDQIEYACWEHSLARVDFAGFSPGISYTKVTSLLFRNVGWLIGGKLKTPAGGMPNFPGMG